MGRQVGRRDSGDVEIQDRSLARVNINKMGAESSIAGAV
jgi:hypothetical protein